MSLTNSNKVSIWHYAMSYGAILGVLWVVRYMFLVGQDLWSPLIYLYYLLNLATFLLAYMFYIKYRDQDNKEPKKRLECIGFVVLLFMCAALFEAAISFVHLHFLDPGYFYTKIEPTLRALAEGMNYPAGVDEQTAKDVKEQTINIATSRSFFIFMEFIKNLILGLIIGSTMALVVGNAKLNQ